MCVSVRKWSLQVAVSSDFIQVLTVRTQLFRFAGINKMLDESHWIL